MIVKATYIDTLVSIDPQHMKYDALAQVLNRLIGRKLARIFRNKSTGAIESRLTMHKCCFFNFT